MEKPDFAEAPVPSRAQNEYSSEPDSLSSKLEGEEDPINWSRVWKGMRLDQDKICFVSSLIGADKY